MNENHDKDTHRVSVPPETPERSVDALDEIDPHYLPDGYEVEL